jgi:DNA repair exonuclease SbcCD ATPase subunit
MLESLDIREGVKQFNMRLDVTKKLKESVFKQLQEAKQDMSDRQNVQNVLRMMAEKMSAESEEITEKIISLGLRDAFFDEELSIEVNHYISHGKPAVKLLLHDQKRGVKGDSLKAFGGGPASLIGILLRVLSIIRQPGMARVLILDEPLIQVSNKFKEKTASILRRICDPVEIGGLGFEMLVISHDDTFKKKANHSYIAKIASDGKSLCLTEQVQEFEGDEDEQ